MIVNYDEFKLQDDYFLKGEADAYFNRNSRKLSNVKKDEDFIFSSIVRMNIKPKTVLEVGCANGFRLNWLNQDYNCRVVGIEPSKQAVEDGNKKFPNIELKIGTSDMLEKIESFFNIIILGFFVYLLPREKLFKLAYEVDRHLEEGVYVVGLDFNTKFPIMNRYAHLKDIYSFKFDLAKMFTWNPQYMEVFKQIINHDEKPFLGNQDEVIGCTILRKNSISQSYMNPKNFQH